MKVMVSLLKFPPDFTGAGLRVEKMYSRLLADKGLDGVFVFTTTDRLSGEDRESRGKMTILFIGGNRYLSPDRSLSGRFKKGMYIFRSVLTVIRNYLKIYKSYDIVHTVDSSWISTMIGWMAYLTKKPLVKEIVLIDTDDPVSIRRSKPFIIRNIFLFPFHSARSIITISEKLKDICISAGIPGQKIWARLNPVYTESLLPASVAPAPEDLNSSDFKNILYVGTLIPRKNIEYLLKAASFLDGKVKLIFVGPSEDRIYYERLLRAANEVRSVTDNRVIPYFPGWISDRSKLASLFLNSDLFWFASIKEGMGNVVIESLLYGTPVVTLPVCGIMREIITCPDEGEVVDDEASPEFFAERVNHYLYERRHDRQALISRARERFDPRKVEEKYIDLFTRLAGVRCF